MIDALRSPLLRVPLLIVTVLVLQVGVVSQLRLASITPDLMLLFAVVAGALVGPERGATIAFCFGLAIDSVVNTPFGLSALSFTLVAYGLAQIQTGVLRGGFLVPATTTFVASAAGLVVWALFAALFGDTHALSFHLVPMILIVGTVNALLSPVARRMMRWAAAADGAVRVTDR